MVRVIGLAVVAACWLCAPAQADVLPIDPSSATVPTTAKAVSSASPVVERIVTGASAASVPSDVTVPDAGAAAEPAVEAAAAKTTVQVAQGRAGDSGGLRVGASSLRRVPPVRLRHLTASRADSTPVRSAPAPRSAHRSPVLAPPATTRAAGSQPVSARPEQNGPPQLPSGPRADAGVATGSAGLFAGGLATLAGALLLVAPRLRRRLLIDPAALRPVAFVALLERPG